MLVLDLKFRVFVKGARKRVKACSLVEGQADRLGWIKKLAESLGYWVDIGYKVMRLTRFEAKENKRCGYLVYKFMRIS